MFDLVKAHFICDQREPSENHGVVVIWGGPITCQQGPAMLLSFGFLQWNLASLSEDWDGV